MPIAEIIQLLIAAGPTIVHGVEELIHAIQAGHVTHEDVLAQLAAARQQAAAALTDLQQAAKDADAAARAEELLPPDGILK